MRRYYFYDRKLLSELSHCAWDSLEIFLLSFPPKQETAPGAVIAIQTFGDFLNFNPHCHVLCTDGGFYASGSFKVAQHADPAGNLANGQWPANPNGSLRDIAGICDPTGRIFGLMPHPEAFNHVTNHPDWTRKKEALVRQGKALLSEEGDGVKVFRNAVEYMRKEVF